MSLICIGMVDHIQECVALSAQKQQKEIANKNIADYIRIYIMT